MEKLEPQEYPEWICFDCGRKTTPSNTPARTCTCHEGICGWCNRNKMVCSPSHYNWPKSPNQV